MTLGVGGGDGRRGATARTSQVREGDENLREFLSFYKVSSAHKMSQHKQNLNLFNTLYL
jgi:hypothetical protein